MPVFRNYTANIGPAGTPQGRPATSADFGTQGGEALEQAGETGLRESRRFHEANEQRELIRTYRDAAVLRENLRRQLDEFKQKGEPASEQMQQVISDQTAELFQTRETRRARALAEQTAATISRDLGHEARMYDAALVGEEAKGAAEEIIQSNGVALQQSPDVFPQIVAEQRQFVEDLDVPKSVKESLLREMNTEAAKNAARGWIAGDPYDAKERLEKGELDEYLTPDNRQALLNNAGTQIRGVEQQARLERVEQQQQQQIESQRVMNKALVDAFSSNPDERLTTAGVTALATQTHPDGTPLLQPSQVEGLYNIVERITEGKAPKTSQAAILEVIPRLNDNTITPEELTEMMASPDWEISGNDYERWMSRAGEGTTALRSVRGEALNNIPGTVGIEPSIAQFFPEFSEVYIKAEAHVIEREREYKEAGKNPIDYYTDGTFQKDVRMLGRKAGIPGVLRDLATDDVDSVTDLQPGDIIGQYRYEGGDPNDLENSYEFVGEAGESNMIGETPEGRPIIRNPDGTVSTEETITEKIGDRWYNIPTIYSGQRVSVDEAIGRITRNDFVDPDTGKSVPVFNSKEAAVSAAEKRTKELGAMIDELDIPNRRDAEVEDAKNNATDMADTVAAQTGEPVSTEKRTRLQALQARIAKNMDVIREDPRRAIAAVENLAREKGNPLGAAYFFGAVNEIGTGLGTTAGFIKEDFARNVMPMLREIDRLTVEGVLSFYEELLAVSEEGAKAAGEKLESE